MEQAEHVMMTSFHSVLLRCKIGIMPEPLNDNFLTGTIPSLLRRRMGMRI